MYVYICIYMTEYACMLTLGLLWPCSTASRQGYQPKWSRGPSQTAWSTSSPSSFVPMSTANYRIDGYEEVRTNGMAWKLRARCWWVGDRCDRINGGRVKLASFISFEKTPAWRPSSSRPSAFGGLASASCWIIVCLARDGRTSAVGLVAWGCDWGRSSSAFLLACIGISDCEFPILSLDRLWSVCHSCILPLIACIYLYARDGWCPLP